MKLKKRKHRKHRKNRKHNVKPIDSKAEKLKKECVSAVEGKTKKVDFSELEKRCFKSFYRLTIKLIKNDEPITKKDDSKYKKLQGLIDDTNKCAQSLLLLFDYNKKTKLIVI